MFIWRNNTVIYDVEIDEKSTRKSVIMGEEIIELSLSVYERMELKQGDYVKWNDFTYTLNQPPVEKKSAKNLFEYNLRFESSKYKLSNVSLLFNNIEADFIISLTADELVDLIVQNMNRVYGTGTWTKGVTVPTEYLNFTFQADNCLNAINKAAKDFGVEVDIVHTEISVRFKIGNLTDLTFGFHSGLKSIKKEAPDTGNIITKLYAFGGDRNIPLDYGTKRLTIEPKENNVSEYGIIEKTVFWDEIYPKFEGVVDSSYDDYYIVDSGINFDLNSYLLSGVPAKFVVNSGELAGYEFEIISYNHSSNTIRLKKYVDENGREFPNIYFQVKEGDKYTFVDIEMPQFYIDNAESQLSDLADDYINDYSLPRYSLTVETDERFFRDNNIILKAGDTITIVDTDLNIEIQRRIAGLTQSLVDEYNYKLILTDEVIISQMVQLAAGQYNIQQKLKWLERQTRVIKNN